MKHIYVTIISINIHETCSLTYIVQLHSTLLATQIRENYRTQPQLISDPLP
ncbi:hypothetical protein Hanom_Chr07g00665271 [Helianthus anomalus]